MLSEKMKSLEMLAMHPKLHLMARYLTVPSGLHSTHLKGYELEQLQHWAARAQRDITVAGLLQFWSVAKHNATDGVIKEADLSYIDSVVNYPGFGKAMEKVGWVRYDSKKNCLILPELNGNNLELEVKKSPGARRQKRYRESLKMKNFITKAITEGSIARIAEEYKKRHPATITPCLTRDASGEVISYGTLLVDGVVHHITVSPGSCCERASKRVRQGVTLDSSYVTQNITDSVMPPVTFGDSGVTQSVTRPVTPDDSGVTQSITRPVIPDDSGVTQSVTHPVTLRDSGVTRSVTHPVTQSDSCVTYHIPCSPSRVIPSRARTRLSFLRSKTLRSKHKTTHSAREENFGLVDNLDPESRIVLRPGGSNSQNSSPDKSTRSKIKTPHSAPDFEAMLNETQNVTLWQNGFSATCVTRKPPPQQPLHSCTNTPVQPKKFRLDDHWRPSKNFIPNAQYIGIPLNHEATDFEIAEFVDYWSEEGAQHTQKQWEIKLARFIGKGRKRAAKRGSGSQDFTIPTSMDYAIPDGFHGG